MKRFFAEISIFPAVGILAILVVLVVIGVWLAGADSAAPVRLSSSPVGIMGTECELIAVAPQAQARRALESAQGALRDAESLMSVHLDASELSKLNAAPADKLVRLSPELMNVLLSAGQLNKQTNGVFDVTCYPLIRLWQRYGSENRLPGEREITETRKRVGMKHLRITPVGVTKLTDGVTIDLGGIAKGYAIDRAIEAMIKAGAVGGVVDVGGDLRCFGLSGRGRRWTVKIRHPFDKARTCAALSVTAAAIATSGDYYRYFEISGKRYSHIVDPRTGWALPVGHAPSVTVVSLPAGADRPNAADADAWATAVSVLGPAGIKLIDAHPGLEAMIITGTPERHEIHMSKGFKSLLSPDGQINLE